MFSGCTNINSIDLGKFNTEFVTDMDNLFDNCVNIN